MRDSLLPCFLTKHEFRIRATSGNIASASSRSRAGSPSFKAESGKVCTPFLRRMLRHFDLGRSLSLSRCLPRWAPTSFFALHVPAHVSADLPFLFSPSPALLAGWPSFSPARTVLSAHFSLCLVSLHCSGKCDDWSCLPSFARSFVSFPSTFLARFRGSSRAFFHRGLLIRRITADVSRYVRLCISLRSCFLKTHPAGLAGLVRKP